MGSSLDFILLTSQVSEWIARNRAHISQNERFKHRFSQSLSINPTLRLDASQPIDKVLEAHITHGHSIQF